MHTKRHSQTSVNTEQCPCATAVHIALWMYGSSHHSIVHRVHGVSPERLPDVLPFVRPCLAGSQRLAQLIQGDAPVPVLVKVLGRLEKGSKGGKKGEKIEG